MDIPKEIMIKIHEDILSMIDDLVEFKKKISDSEQTTWLYPRYVHYLKYREQEIANLRNFESTMRDIKEKDD